MCGQMSEALYAFAGARWTTDGDTSPIFCADCRQFPVECLYVCMWVRRSRFRAWPWWLYRRVAAPSRLLLSGRHRDHVVRGLWWDTALVGFVLVLAAYSILGRYWWAGVVSVLVYAVCMTHYRIKAARADWRTYKSRWP